MWIKRDRYDALVRRVEDLEASVLKLTRHSTFTVQNHINGYGFINPSVDIPHNDLFRKILDHLGLKFEVKSATDASANLVAITPPTEGKV